VVHHSHLPPTRIPDKTLSVRRKQRMAESLVLKSAHGGAEVRLQRPDATTIDVEINAAGLHARTGFTSSTPHLSHSSFKDMARDWRGWPDAREWKSLESDFSLSCTTDGLGHVSVRLQLYSDCSRTGWAAGVDLVLEAGQLDNLARDAVRVFRSSETSLPAS